MAGMLGVGALFHREGKLGLHRLGQRRIIRILPGKFLLFKRFEGLVQQFQESAVVLEGTVQIDRAVRRMIIGVVVILQHLPGHLRDHRRVAAVIVADTRAREGRAQEVDVGHAGQRRRALHLRIDRAFDRQRGIRVFHAVAPGFLAEDALVFHDHGIEAAVDIQIRVLKELFLGQAGHRIGRHLLRGLGVHVRVIGLIDQIEEQ